MMMKRRAPGVESLTVKPRSESRKSTQEVLEEVLEQTVPGRRLEIED